MKSPGLLLLLPMSSCLIKTNQLSLFMSSVFLKAKGTHQTVCLKTVNTEKHKVMLARGSQDRFACRMPSECRYDVNFLFLGGCVSGNGSLLWISVKCLLCSVQLGPIPIRTLVPPLSPVLQGRPWHLLWPPRGCGPFILPHHSSAPWAFYPCLHSNFQ